MKWLLPLLLCAQVQAATLYVTNYGALPDLLPTRITTAAGSYSATSETNLGAGSIGKILSILSAGNTTSSTTRQDFVVQITNISGTTISMNRPAGFSTNLSSAIYGTCSSTGFQSAINAASNGDTVAVPAGNYLLIPPVWNTNWLLGSTRFAEGAVTISKGGFRLVGTGNPTLTGNGAFQLTSGGSVYRGHIFNVTGPFTNSYANTLAFEGMTFDGGVLRGRTFNQGFPANIITGDGWDITHDAIWVGGSVLPLATNNIIAGCTFQRWRGEMVKSTLDIVTGDFYGITNCVFRDGNASGVNIMYGSAVVGCLFTNLDIGMECFTSISTVPYYFINNSITNVRSGITVQGAQVARLPVSPYLLHGNIFHTSEGSINIGPAQNVTVRSNYFHDITGSAIVFGPAGGQGDAAISNIVVVGNVASNVETKVQIFSGSHIYMTNNFLHGGFPSSHFVSGGTIGTGGEIYLSGNTSVSSRSGVEFAVDAPVFPLDLPNNDFPWHDVDDFFGATNGLNYASGRPQRLNDLHASSKIWLVNTNASQIPFGVQMTLTNVEGATHVIYRNAAATIQMASLTNFTATNFFWNGASWGFTSPPPYFVIQGNLTVSGNATWQQ